MRPSASRRKTRARPASATNANKLARRGTVLGSGTVETGAAVTTTLFELYTLRFPCGLPSILRVKSDWEPVGSVVVTRERPVVGSRTNREKASGNDPPGGPMDRFLTPSLCLFW